MGLLKVKFDLNGDSVLFVNNSVPEYVKPEAPPSTTIVFPEAKFNNVVMSVFPVPLPPSGAGHVLRRYLIFPAFNGSLII